MSNAGTRPKNYPAVGDTVYHAMECNDEPWEIVAINPHSDPRKTRQRAVTLHGQHTHRERTFEMSVRNFWFNWSPKRTKNF